MTESASALNTIADLVDGFEPLSDAAPAQDPLRWPGYGSALARARQRTGDQQSVTAGRASIGSQPCVTVAFNFAFMGGSMGVAEGRRITEAIAVAVSERLPLVSVLRSGGVRMQEGMPALVQMQRVSRGLVELGAAGIPHICVARNPTTGGVWAAVGAGADIIIGESGAAVAFAGARVRGDAGGSDEAFRAEAKWERGLIDDVLPAERLCDRVAQAISLLSPQTRGIPELPPLPTGSQDGVVRSGWDQVQRARAPGRPKADDYLNDYFSRVLEIRGDRVGGVDPSVRCGFGARDGRTIAFVAQSGAVTRAAGYRAAARLVALAAKLEVPILTLIDSPGADGTVAGEADGVAGAIAGLLQTIATASVPILSVTIGEGGSGGTLALASQDNLWITADGYFSVITPESATAILKRPAEEVPTIANQLRLGPRDLRELGIVRGILEA
jgi:acetyl-CoA carboxylase carboxyl transferase subunit beta